MVIRGAERDARLPRPARRDRRDDRRRLAAHRRRRPPRRRRLPHARRPDQGHDHPRRREHLPQGDRERSRPRTRRARGGGGRRAGRRATARCRSPTSSTYPEATVTPTTCSSTCAPSSPRSRSRSPIHIVEALPQEPRRQDRQASPARPSTDATPEANLRSPRKERPMGFMTGLPTGRPRDLPRQAVLRAHPDRSPMHWVEYGFGTPKMMHADLHRQAARALHRRRRCSSRR